jgi:hypothetical protein
MKDEGGKGTLPISSLILPDQGILGMLDPWEQQYLRSRTHDRSAHVCVLCGQPIVDGRGAPTTDGFHVHIRCADAQAVQAFARRQCYALIHVGTWGLVIWGWAAGGSHWMIGAAVVGAALHPILHRRWWRVAFRRTRGMKAKG